MTAPTTMQWIREAAHRLSTGSARLATQLLALAIGGVRTMWRRATGWLGEASGLSWLLRLAALLALAAVLRKVVTAVAVALYARVEDGSAPWLLWGAAGLWVIAAYRCGRDGWAPKEHAVEPVEDDVEQPEEPAVEAPVPAGPPAVAPAELAAAVHAIGTPHAQLRPLAEHLGTTTDAVRAAAAGMGWPVKDVRMAGRSSTAGLRADEAPPLPPTAPSGGVVGAGQAADDNDDDTSGEGRREGLRKEPIGQSAFILRDPAETVRHHMVRGK
ncbi:hypothetical protein KBZ00_25960 [Streptomyces sp. RK31]|uniref:hypothetical protein n=1 Tax=Streptomyces sp. RK31 TaxID=2824892 RepID=UPI001B37C77F|nr:hypothetical protein [Streptomyces sp. RK31]MBQ0974546.1 hypothetical protein [Streptomyces sp. RK31]